MKPFKISLGGVGGELGNGDGGGGGRGKGRGVGGRRTRVKNYSNLFDIFSNLESKSCFMARETQKQRWKKNVQMDTGHKNTAIKIVMQICTHAGSFCMHAEWHCVPNKTCPQAIIQPSNSHQTRQNSVLRLRNAPARRQSVYGGAIPMEPISMAINYFLSHLAWSEGIPLAGGPPGTRANIKRLHFLLRSFWANKLRNIKTDFTLNGFLFVSDARKYFDDFIPSVL